MLLLLLFSLLNFARFIFSYIFFAVVLEFLLCVRVFFAPSLALSFAYFYFHFILMFTFIAFFLHQFIQLFFFALFPQYWASEVSIFFLHFGLSSCCVVFYSAFWLHTFNARTVVHWMIFGWLWWLLVHTRTYTHNENQHQPSTIYKYSFNSFLATANQ